MRHISLKSIVYPRLCALCAHTPQDGQEAQFGGMKTDQVRSRELLGNAQENSGFAESK
jgi:hypothetical protein